MMGEGGVTLCLKTSEYGTLFDAAMFTCGSEDDTNRIRDSVRPSLLVGWIHKCKAEVSTWRIIEQVSYTDKTEQSD